MRVIRINVYKPYPANPQATQMLVDLIKKTHGKVENLKTTVTKVRSSWGRTPVLWSERIVVLTEWNDERDRDASILNPPFREFAQLLTKGWTGVNPEDDIVDLVMRGNRPAARRDHSIPDEQVIFDCVETGFSLETL